MSQRFTSVMALLALLGLQGCVLSGAARTAMDERTPVAPAQQREYDAAVAALTARDFERAAHAFAALGVQLPDAPNVHVNEALAWFELDNLELAAAAAGQALRLQPSHPTALNLLGMVKRRQGDFDAAAGIWGRLVEQQPDYAYAWYNLGVLYDVYLQDLPLALEHYRRYQELSGSGSDETVARWIADIETRIGRIPQTAQVQRDIG